MQKIQQSQINREKNQVRRYMLPNCKADYKGTVIKTEA